jgi:hypothetical protein
LIVLAFGTFVLIGCQAHLEQNPPGIDDDDATDDDDDIADDDATADDDDTANDDDDTSPEDIDGDGYSPADGDCNDHDDSVHPGAGESCDAVDSDCDGDFAEECSSCYELLEAGGSQGDGVYALDISGEGVVDVACNMSVDGGGWTLVQRTNDVWAESSILHTDYATFQGSTLGSAEGVFRLAGRHWPALLEGDELMVEYLARQEDYSPCGQSLFHKVTSVAISVPPTGTATVSGYQQSVLIISNEQLSTTDAGPNTSCINSYSIVPWFIAGCGNANPTFYSSTWWPTDPNPRMNYVSSVSDLLGHTTADVCATTPVEINGYTAGSMMAVWLR